ncbi:MAG TPA: hypothetical protein DCG53_00925 [Syntrophus sp. (in: bacteria)]|jgi:hypothetical protein|nr:hypothetical protein [Syntrophus sp. (in: bacteria)]
MDEEITVKKEHPVKMKIFVPAAAILTVIIVVILVVMSWHQSADEQQPVAPQVQNRSRFVAYNDGTVLDTKSNLIWAAKDNGSGINWKEAKEYCENYRGGGHSDWRLPTSDELTGLFASSKSRPSACNAVYNIRVATELIDLSCYATWTSETRGSQAAYFSFNTGSWYWKPRSHATSTRSLPVRSAK